MKLATDTLNETPNVPAMKGHYLAEWIAFAGMEQLELARMAGYEKTHFNKIVKGRNRLSREKRKIIAEALTQHLGYEVSPDDLLSIPPASAIMEPVRKRTEADQTTGVEDDMLRLARPVIAALVQQLGLEAVIREAVSASNRMRTEEQQSNPPGRQRTS
jgi:transcriptional regulator with XRE-family HTH domain